MTERLVVTPEEAAEVLKVSRSRIYELIRKGEIASVKLGRVRRIRVEKLREYLDRLEAEQAG
jgi:excisionase family DNA binding protein